MRVHKGTYIQTERGIHMRVIIPDFRNFSFVPDILLPLLRGLGGFFLNCTTNSHTHTKRERQRKKKKQIDTWKRDRERKGKRDLGQAENGVEEKCKGHMQVLYINHTNNRILTTLITGDTPLEDINHSNHRRPSFRGY